MGLAMQQQVTLFVAVFKVMRRSSAFAEVNSYIAVSKEERELGVIMEFMQNVSSVVALVKNKK